MALSPHGVNAIQLPKLQTHTDGIYNRRGFTERGFRFSMLDELEQLVKDGTVKALVLLYDAPFSGAKETERLKALIATVPFSLVLESVASGIGNAATAQLPITTYLEEADFVTTHTGELRRYQKALEPPKGVKTVPLWVKELVKELAPVTAAV